MLIFNVMNELIFGRLFWTILAISAVLTLLPTIGFGQNKFAQDSLITMGYDLPIRWAGPISIRAISSNEEHDEFVESARDLAISYSMASQVEILPNQNLQSAYNLIILTGNSNQIESEILRLGDYAGDGFSKISNTINDEKYDHCYTLISHDTSDSNFHLIESSIVFASSSLSDLELKYCLLQQVSSIFGLSTQPLRYYSEATDALRLSIFYSMNLVFLTFKGICESASGENFWECYERNLKVHSQNLIRISS